MFPVNCWLEMPSPSIHDPEKYYNSNYRVFLSFCFGAKCSCIYNTKRCNLYKLSGEAGGDDLRPVQRGGDLGTGASLDGALLIQGYLRHCGYVFYQNDNDLNYNISCLKSQQSGYNSTVKNDLWRFSLSFVLLVHCELVMFLQGCFFAVNPPNVKKKKKIAEELSWLGLPYRRSPVRAPARQ